MKKRYRLFLRGSVFWCQENLTGKQQTLRTKDRETANRLLNAKNEAEQQPYINLQIARAYLMAADPKAADRTWQFVMQQMKESKKRKKEATQDRWERAIKDHAFDSIRNLPLLETRSEHFLNVINNNHVSANIYLRRIHNFALDMNWLPVPVIPKRQWPTFRFKDKRGF